MTAPAAGRNAVDVLTFGESMGSLRSTAALRLGGPMELHLAGAESNVAIGLSRLGHTARWAGRLGSDELGEFVLRQLRAEGVLVDRVTRDGQRPTGLMFLEQRTADISRAHYYRAGSAGSAVSAAQLEPALADGARVLHLTGITPSLSPSAAEAVEWAARTAAAAGMIVSLDVNYRSKLWSRSRARSVLARLVPHVSIVISSDDELDLLGPDDGAAPPSEAAAVARLLAGGVSEVAVKRGAAGASVYTADGDHAEEPTQVSGVDTVGAGDAFSAGYLSALLDGADVPARLHRGAVLGAFAVSTAGDWEGLPDRAELALLDHGAGTTVR